MTKTEVIQNLFLIAQWLKDNSTFDDSLNREMIYLFPAQLENVALHVYDCTDRLLENPEGEK